MTAVRAPRCPPLPAETWGEILVNVEDLDLWVICRQVSRTLRLEAEREFARNRLGQLEVTASLSKTMPKKRGVRLYSRTTSICKLLGVSIRGVKAVFCARFRNMDERPGALNSIDLRILDRLRRKSISNSDFHYRRRHRERSKIKQVVEFGCYWGTVPISGVEVNLEDEAVSFNWKALMNDLLGLYAHVQRLQGRRLDTAVAAEEELRERFFCPQNTPLRMGKMYEIAKSFKRGFELDQRYLMRAYLARLRRRMRPLESRLLSIKNGVQSGGRRFRTPSTRTWNRFDPSATCSSITTSGRSMAFGCSPDGTSNWTGKERVRVDSYMHEMTSVKPDSFW